MTSVTNNATTTAMTDRETMASATAMISINKTQAQTPNEVIGGFALLLVTCLFVAFFAGDHLGLLLVVGITTLIFTHIFQNMGMTIAMLPITGVPLPLISYSGSFVLMIMFGLGLVNSVWIHRHIPA